MGLLRRLALILRGYAAATGDKIDRVAAEEELRLTTALKSQSATKNNASPIASVSPSKERLEAEYRLLGLRPGSDLGAVEAAWKRLALRADPKRFPAGSEEEKTAAQILNSINQAYTIIREELNPTEGRFGKLEL